MVDLGVTLRFFGGNIAPLRNAVPSLTNSYWAFGNTGSHVFDQAINSGNDVAGLNAVLTNYSTAQISNIFNALISLSDHLPVVAGYQLPANWAGSVSGGTAGRLFFGSNASGLGTGQLSQITFSGYAAGAQILGTGELVPLNLTAAVPEPGTYAAAVILLVLAIWHHHRRRMRSQALAT